MNAIITYMKKNFKIVLAILCLSGALFAFKINGSKQNTEDPEKDRLLLELLTFVIEKGHYDPAVMDDEFSKGVYKDYIQALDPSKRFFLQSDIAEFAKYELDLDDQINNKELTFFELTYSRLMVRMEESKKIYKGLLETPNDFYI